MGGDYLRQGKKTGQKTAQNAPDCGVLQGSASRSCAPFALNVFIPSLPRLAEAFQSDYGTAQLALTLFLVGIALGQPIYGPLSDCYGRRPVLLGGLVIGLLGSILCLVAPTIEILLVGRFLQAFGGCVGLVLSRAMVRDLFARDRAASELAYVTMGMSLMPMVAPSIGGLLDEHLGWRASFVLLTAFVAVVLLGSWARAAETNHQRQARVDFGHLARGWSLLVRSPVFVGYTLAMSFNTVAFFAFLAVAPYLMVTVMGRAPSEYGFWFAGCAASYLIGNFVTGRYSQRIGLDRMVRIGNVCSLAGTGFGLVSASRTDFRSPISLQGPSAWIQGSQARPRACSVSCRCRWGRSQPSF